MRKLDIYALILCFCVIAALVVFTIGFYWFGHLFNPFNIGHEGFWLPKPVPPEIIDTPWGPQSWGVPLWIAYWWRGATSVFAAGLGVGTVYIIVLLIKALVDFVYPRVDNKDD